MKIAIVGGFQNGKSTLINCLLRVKLAQTGGDGVSVTSVNVTYCYNTKEKVLSINSKPSKNKILDILKGNIPKANEISIGYPSKILEHLTIVDTPGFNAQTCDTQIALKALDEIEAAIVVINNKGLSTVEMDIFRELQGRNIPYFIIMNCMWQEGTAISTWNPISNFNQVKISELSAKIHNEGLTPMLIGNKIITPVNAIWFWYAISQFRYEEKDKKEVLLEKIDQYKKKCGDVDFEKESRLYDIIIFFSNTKQWLPIIIYNRWVKNLNMFISNTLNLTCSYKDNIYIYTQNEIEQIIETISTKQKELVANEGRIFDYKREQEKNEKQEFEKPLMMISHLLSGEFINAGICGWNWLKSSISSKLLSEDIRDTISTSQTIENELNTSESYLKLLSKMYNPKNN